LPPILFRWNLLFGLAIVVVVLLVIYVIARIILGWLIGQSAQRHDTTELAALYRTKAILNSLITPVMAITIAVFIAIAAMTGWGFDTPDKRAGDLKPAVVPGQLGSGSNKPTVRSKELRKEGDDLQEERMKELQNFRDDFFKKRSNASSESPEPAPPKAD